VATVRPGVLTGRVDDGAPDCEESLLAGRYVLTTPLGAEVALATDIFRHDRMLQTVKRRFRVMRDRLGLRPGRYRLEVRVRSHVVLRAIVAGTVAVTGTDPAVNEEKVSDLPERRSPRAGCSRSSARSTSTNFGMPGARSRSSTNRAHCRAGSSVPSASRTPPGEEPHASDQPFQVTHRETSARDALAGCSQTWRRSPVARRCLSE
jgi:hypothetical protein